MHVSNFFLANQWQGSECCVSDCCSQRCSTSEVLAMHPLQLLEALLQSWQRVAVALVLAMHLLHLGDLPLRAGSRSQSLQLGELLLQSWQRVAGVLQLGELPLQSWQRVGGSDDIGARRCSCSWCDDSCSRPCCCFLFFASQAAAIGIYLLCRHGYPVSQGCRTNRKKVQA